MTVVQMSEQSNEVAERRERAPVDVLIAQVRSDGTRQQIEAALPPRVPSERFIRAAVTALREDAIKQSKPEYMLVNADQDTLFLALVKCATDGLMPDGRQAALVVYKGKVQYLPMIGGVRQIAAEFGWAIRTHVVYANDAFEVIEGTEQRIEHRPCAPGVDRGQLVAAYAVAQHRDGRRGVVEVMYEPEIMKAKSVAKTDTVWKQWPAQMWEKTVGHRIAKKLPLDPQDRERLTRVINAVELGPEESAAALYGPAARASFGELPSGSEPYVDTPQVSSGADAPTESPSEPSTESQTAPAPSGGSPDDGQTEATAQPSDAPVEAAATPLPEPTEEERMLAAEAGLFVPLSGRFAEAGNDGPLTLEQIFEFGDGEGKTYLGMLLRQLSPGPWRDAVQAFGRVHLPVQYAAALARAAQKAA